MATTKLLRPECDSRGAIVVYKNTLLELTEAQPIRFRRRMSEPSVGFWTEQRQEHFAPPLTSFQAPAPPISAGRFDRQCGSGCVLRTAGPHLTSEQAIEPSGDGQISALAGAISHLIVKTTFGVVEDFVSGRLQAPAMNFPCRRCHFPVSRSYRFCPTCGHRVDQQRVAFIHEGCGHRHHPSALR